jgi:hypothetical protein
VTASDWAAWLGAVTGVAALGWEIVRWWREGKPHLLVRSSAYLRLTPSTDRKPLLVTHVTNTGKTGVTLTTLGMFTFPSAWSRFRFRPASNWVMLNNAIGPDLPRELQPGQQWTCGFQVSEGHRNRDPLCRHVPGGFTYTTGSGPRIARQAEVMDDAPA